VDGRDGEHDDVDDGAPLILRQTKDRSRGALEVGTIRLRGDETGDGGVHRLVARHP